jgi:hypothetical protein
VKLDPAHSVTGQRRDACRVLKDAGHELVSARLKFDRGHPMCLSIVFNLGNLTAEWPRCHVTRI